MASVLLYRRPHRAEAKRCLCLTSVCLSVAYIGPNLRTERQTRICTEVDHVTRASDTTFHAVMWSETVGLRLRLVYETKKSVLVLYTAVLILVLQICCCFLKHDLVTLVVILKVKDTDTFQVLFIVSLFYAWNITTVEIKEFGLVYITATFKVKGQLVAGVLNSQHAGTGATWRINAKILSTSTCRGRRHIVSPRAQLVNVYFKQQQSFEAFVWQFVTRSLCPNLNPMLKCISTGALQQKETECFTC